MSDLLQEVQKLEENEARGWARYPPSVSARNNNSNGNSPTYKGQSDGTGYKGSHYKDKKPDTIGVRIVNATTLMMEPYQLRLRRSHQRMVSQSGMMGITIV